MSHDDVIRMAQQAGFYDDLGRTSDYWKRKDGVTEFANLVAAKAAAEERDACAAICDIAALEAERQAEVCLTEAREMDAMANAGGYQLSKVTAALIRARGTT